MPTRLPEYGEAGRSSENRELAKTPVFIKITTIEEYEGGPQRYRVIDQHELRGASVTSFDYHIGPNGEEFIMTCSNGDQYVTPVHSFPDFDAPGEVELVAMFKILKPNAGQPVRQDVLALDINDCPPELLEEMRQAREKLVSATTDSPAEPQRDDNVKFLEWSELQPKLEIERAKQEAAQRARANAGDTMMIPPVSGVRVTTRRSLKRLIGPVLLAAGIGAGLALAEGTCSTAAHQAVEQK